MKRIIAVILTSALLIIIQASPAFDLIRVKLIAKPDILLVFIAFIAFRYGAFEGMIYGFIAGLGEDIISSGLFASNALVFLNVGFFIGLFNNKIFSGEITAGIFISVVAYLIKIVLSFLIFAVYFDIQNVAVYIRNEILVGMPLTMIVASTMFLLLSRIAPMFYDRKGITVNDGTSRYVGRG